ncbi:MAG: universal stress protein [Acidobacteriota bacterium]|nr:universal stress protein [Acidobacteriota bacterium]
MREIKTILVPVDFSAGSAWALDYAQMVAKRFGAAIHLVHVCEVPSMATASMDVYAIAYSDFSQRLGDEAERELAGIAAGIQGVKTSTEILFGNPARCIVTAATTNNADLIVMGTHGHGPIAHVVMGNVAERVVRTAPCPVLTVREPRAADWHKPHARVAQMVAGLVMAVVLSPWLTTGVAAQVVPPPAPAPVVADPVTEMRQRITGGATFRTYCASCHGTAARGDGPLAENMRRKPADLTEIAKRNGGLFPTDMVFRTIDGRQPVRGHGGADMPVWGDTFMKSREGGDADTVRETIESLVRFLESLQTRPVH